MNQVEIYVSISAFVLCACFCILAIRTSKLCKTKAAQSHLIEGLLKKKSVSTMLAVLNENEKEIKEKLSVGKDQYSKLSDSLKKLEAEILPIKVGLYPPAFKFDDSEELKRKILAVRAKQIKCIQKGGAVQTASSLEWLGDFDKGQRILDSTKLLIIMAFNAEVDSIRKQMRESTYRVAMEKFSKVGSQLKGLGETIGCTILPEYFNLKSEELKTWHSELEQKELRKKESIRQKEILRAQKKVERIDTEEIQIEIQSKQSDLRMAQKNASKIAGEQRRKLDDRIAKLQSEIETLASNYSREISQAQITRSGYVYVISNHGSFGRDVLKIGMTRRLEPMDRVSELGDASVPFRFDVHALAFVQDAPKLESALHRKFHKERVNSENFGKEFFRVKLSEVKTAMADLGVSTEWYFDAEAKEFMESELLRMSAKRNLDSVKSHIVSDLYPKSI